MIFIVNWLKQKTQRSIKTSFWHSELELFFAIKANDAASVRRVLATNGSASSCCVLDDEGYHTPYEMAKKRGNTEIIQLLDAYRTKR